MEEEVIKMDSISVIHKYIVEECNDGIEINNEENIIERGVLDSLRVMNLVVFLEETFDIEIDLSEIDAKNMESIINIVSLVERKQKNHLNVKNIGIIQ